jgi:hypothetical protein
LCLDRYQHDILAEAGTHNFAWSPDHVDSISQSAALANILRVTADRLVAYGDELNHQNRASVTPVSGNDHQTYNARVTLLLLAADDRGQTAILEADDAESEMRENFGASPWRAKLEGVMP